MNIEAQIAQLTKLMQECLSSYSSNSVWQIPKAQVLVVKTEDEENSKPLKFLETTKKHYDQQPKGSKPIKNPTSVQFPHHDKSVAIVWPLETIPKCPQIKSYLLALE